jgi:hypothetical protein
MYGKKLIIFGKEFKYHDNNTSIVGFRKAKNKSM